jgi:hypothetical protein
MHSVDETTGTSFRSILEQRMAFGRILYTTLVDLTADTRTTSTIPLKYIAADIIINSDKVLDIWFSGLDCQSQNITIITLRYMAKKDKACAPWMKITKQYHNSGQKSNDIRPNCRHWIVTNAQNKLKSNRHK